MLAAHLTARDRWILRMLAEHRVLTTEHLRALAFAGSLRYTQTRLRTLAGLGVIAGFRRHTPTGSVPYHWVLEHPGRVVLAAEDDQPAPARDARQVGRGLALAHNRQLGHQLGVNTCLVHLATSPTTGARGDAGVGFLELWWGQARCTRHFPTARPDAYAIWTQPDPSRRGGWERLAFYLEYDTGSETLDQLSAKLAGYHRLAATTAASTPLLFWLPSPRREHTARHALARAHAALPHPRLVSVATAHPARDRADLGWHPHHPTWTLLDPPTEPKTTARLSLAELTTHRSHTRPRAAYPDMDAGIDGNVRHEGHDIPAGSSIWGGRHPTGQAHLLAERDLTATRASGTARTELTAPRPTPPAPTLTRRGSPPARR